MADQSAHLALPFLAPSQAQKHVTHNGALRRLDGLVHLAVESVAAIAPPGSPVQGERHLLGASPTGDWTGRGGDLAVFADGAWWFATPQIGWLAYDKASETLLVLKAAGWTSV
ncbi:DUF2793 domain-containing protein [Kaistia terrae]|uniref:DUF2793 domain-containing protein n=1 Tax=Kaistia terrae TaxID=537017 RepID=A0ABW0PUQ9_9HYPH|nr:DUF2793 domain-containing protein [Kaistia terrae]MCX5576877.1 DUF2793 domain-containing protein [Kaistia terrae]